MDTAQGGIVITVIRICQEECVLSKITDCRLASNSGASCPRLRPAPVPRPLEPRPWSAGSSPVLPLSGPRQIPALPGCAQAHNPALLATVGPTHSS
jgi:hypothetical protein